MKNLFFTLLFLIGFSALNSQTQFLPTENGDIKMTPILHSTMVLEWNGKTIYMDPYGGAERFSSFPKADIVCITHPHGDHLNKETLEGLDLQNTELIAPQSVIDDLGPIPFKRIRLLTNGQTYSTEGIDIAAIPMYNLPNDATARHKKGWGNAYIITIGGKRIYVSGDTEDIPEMRSLTDIDYAFVCMNLPYTMTVEAAADAVLDFKPAVVFPFHFRGQGGFSDVEKFKSIVNAGNQEIAVKILDWYPEN